jgi:hypothetical protein
MTESEESVIVVEIPQECNATALSETATDIARDRFLAALLAGNSLTDAARLAGISRTTGWRWRRDESFAARLRERRTELLDATVDGLRAAASDFVRTLRDIASDPEERGFDRVAACKHALDAMFRGIQVTDFAERIAKVEQAVDENEQSLDQLGAGGQGIGQSFDGDSDEPLKIRDIDTCDPLIVPQNQEEIQ